MCWELIRQRKHMQINIDNTNKNRNRIDYDDKVGDNVMLTRYIAYKYEMTYKVHFAIKHCFTNHTVILQYVVTQIQYNIRRIKLYKSDTKVEYFNSKICLTMSTYMNMLDMTGITSYILLFLSLNLG